MSKIAVTITRLMVINHALRYSYNAIENQRIEQLFNFKPNSILRREQQIKSLFLIMFNLKLKITAFQTQNFTTFQFY